MTGCCHFFEEHEITLPRVLTDRRTEHCGTDGHDYELYLAVEDIHHLRTKAKSPRLPASVNGFTRLCSMSPTESPFAEGFTDRSMSYKPIWIRG
jgi:hypothetical protein